MPLKLILISLFGFLIGFHADAGTCTADSYTNASANSVLTSTKYNSDNSTIYNRLNGNLDGGCVSDGTLEDGSLNTTDFAALLNGLKEGCKVTRSDAATLSVDKCIASVNGNFIKTTSANTVTWGCTSCSAEVASTDYYLYIKDGSAGTTLNLLISTTSPNDDGYDGSNNKVIARFYNNGSSDIDQYSIDQWLVNKFVPQSTGEVDFTPTFENFGTVSNESTIFKRMGKYIYIRGYATTGTTVGSALSISLPSDIVLDLTNHAATNTNAVGTATRIQNTRTHDDSARYILFSDGSTTTKVFGSAVSASDTALTKSNGSSLGSGESFIYEIFAPIAGWND